MIECYTVKGQLFVTDKLPKFLSGENFPRHPEDQSMIWKWKEHGTDEWVYARKENY